VSNEFRRGDEKERGIYQRRVLLKLSHADVDYLLKVVSDNLSDNPKGLRYPTMQRIYRKLGHARDRAMVRSGFWVRFAFSKPEAYHLMDMLDQPSDLHQEILTAYGRALVGQFEKELNGLGYPPVNVDRDPVTGDFRRMET
jgi:hypothetical protein